MKTKIQIIFLIYIIYHINCQINNIEIINYKAKGIDSNFNIEGKQTFELIFDSEEIIPEKLHIKLKSLNHLKLLTSISTQTETTLKNNPFSGSKIEFNLKRPQLSTKNNYIYISCENSLFCKFNLEIYNEKNEMNQNLSQKNNLKSFFQFQEDDDDVILRTSSNIKIDLYILESIYEGGLSIPSDRKKIYQIPEGEKGKYKITKGDSVQVNYYGTITPKNSTMYCYNFGIWACSSWEQPDKPADIIKVEYTVGTSIVTATIDGKEYQITVNVKDYGDEYVESILNDYIKKNVTKQKTQLDKLKSITAFPAQFPYNASCSGAKGMIIYKGGDCWASTDTINLLCKKVGIKSHSRYAAKDTGAGSGHYNVAALIDGKIYIAEAGYGYEYPNRPYHVTKLNVGYSYKGRTGGIYIYQYDGYDSKINVPSSIDNQKVLSLQEAVFYNGYNDGKHITKITLPDTIDQIAFKVFKNLPNITSIKIPKNVSSIGTEIFAGCDKLTSIDVDSSNKYFSSRKGILYDFNKTIIYYYPPGKEGNYTCLRGLKKINYYSFYSIKKMYKVYIPKTVTEIGSYAFASSSIKELYFEGNPPSFGQNSLQALNLSIYYPKNNSNWTKSVMSNAGAKDIRLIEWIPSIKYDDESHVFVYVTISIVVVIIIAGIIFFILRRNARKKKDYLNTDFGKHGLIN